MPTAPALTPPPVDRETAAITATPLAANHPTFPHGPAYFLGGADLADFLATAPDGTRVYELDRATGQWQDRTDALPATPQPAAAAPRIATTSRLYPATSEGEHLVESRGHQLILALSVDTPEGGGTYLVDVTLALDAAAHLTWSDGVANEVSERHASLAVALARLATLQACCEANWDRMFVHPDAAAFAPAARAFLDGATTA